MRERKRERERERERRFVISGYCSVVIRSEVGSEPIGYGYGSQFMSVSALIGLYYKR